MGSFIFHWGVLFFYRGFFIGEFYFFIENFLLGSFIFYRGFFIGEFYFLLGSFIFYWGVLFFIGEFYFLLGSFIFYSGVLFFIGEFYFLLVSFINPWRACAEACAVVVSCVCVCVCMYVCLSAHAILAVCAIKKYNERYHRVKREICGNIKKAFFLKLFYSKVRASFTYLGRGRPSLVDSYSACNVSYTLRYMFAYA